MKRQSIIFLLIFIFLATNIFVPYAYARRRPAASSKTEETEEQKNDQEKVKKQEVKWGLQEESGEELKGEALEQYLLNEETLSIEKKKKEEEPETKEEPESEGEETGFNTWTPTNAMLRSLILPGWGQFFNEQYTKGYIFAGTEVVLLSTALIFYNQADSAYNDYKSGSASYDDYSKKIDNTNLVVGIFGAVWVYNVIDAYINAFGDEEQQSFLRKDGFAVVLNNNQELSIFYSKKF